MKTKFPQCNVADNILFTHSNGCGSFHNTKSKTKSMKITKPNAPCSLKHFAALLILIATISCKKEASPSGLDAPPTVYAALAAETDSTEYNMANAQQALDDVELVDDRLKFRNREHLLITALVLDSIGDSLAQDWMQNLGFSSLYNEFTDALDEMPGDESEQAQFFSENTNAVFHEPTYDIINVNAGFFILSRVINSEHKAWIGDNIFYSDYHADVLVGPNDEAMIETYKDQEESQNNTTAYVQRQHTAYKTTGAFVAHYGQSSYIGEVNCGSPISHMSKSWLYMARYFDVYYVAAVNVFNYKRHWFGGWTTEKRGAQVSGTFNSLYYWQQKVWPNHAYVHNFSNYWGPSSSVVGSNIDICIAPVCNGITVCQNF